jgi:hypothetical protein
MGGGAEDKRGRRADGRRLAGAMAEAGAHRADGAARPAPIFGSTASVRVHEAPAAAVGSIGQVPRVLCCALRGVERRRR